MKSIARFIVFACAAMFAFPAWAEGPCDYDIEKFCKDVKGGEARLAVCLWKHQNNLSNSCKKLIEKDLEEAKSAHDACEKDAQKYCKDVKPGEGRIAACLAANQDKLSMACHKTVRVGKESGGSFVKACAGDMKKHCSDVKPGKGRVLACLHEKKAELTVDCTKAVERRK